MCMIHMYDTYVMIHMLWCTCYDTYVMIHMLWYMCYDTHVMIHRYDTSVAISAQSNLAQAIYAHVWAACPFRIILGCLTRSRAPLRRLSITCVVKKMIHMLWYTCYATDVMIHVLWYICYDTYVMIHVYDTYVWYICYDTHVMMHMLWYICYDTCVMIHMLWYICMIHTHIT